MVGAERRLQEKKIRTSQDGYEKGKKDKNASCHVDSQVAARKLYIGMKHRSRSGAFGEGHTGKKYFICRLVDKDNLLTSTWFFCIL